MPDYSRDVFVREGMMQVRGLGRKGLARPLPPGECAITALVCGPQGRIYGATSGRRAHLFRYDPGPMGDCVMHIGAIGQEREAAALAAHDHFVFGATGEGGGWLFRYDTSHDTVSDYGYGRGEIEMLCQPLQGEPIAGMALQPARRLLCGIGRASGTVFIYDLDSSAVTRIGAATAAGVVSSPLIVTRDAVYGAVEQGRVFRCDLDTGGLERLEVFLPSLAGLEHYNRLHSAAQDGDTVYGGTGDGVLFRWHLPGMSFVTLGKPVAQPGMPALTVGSDGRVFGIGGDRGGMAHLFCHDPRTGDTRDLGIPMATSERYWHGYEFGAAATGCGGEIYLGEADRISHLFIYHPPLQSSFRAD